MADKKDNGKVENNEARSKTCFVIAPIGDPGTDTRKRADQILQHIIDPVVQSCGYEKPIRADQISQPGIITNQIVRHLVEDDLVVADLTDLNPNVFYELALRHALAKPIVQIIQQGQSIPFDVRTVRTISVDHHDLDSVAACKVELAEQIRAVEKDPRNVDNPISMALDLQALQASDKPLEKTVAEIADAVQELRLEIWRATSASRRQVRYPTSVSERLSEDDSYLYVFESPTDPGTYYEFQAHTDSDKFLARNLMHLWPTIDREGRGPTAEEISKALDVSTTGAEYILKRLKRFPASNENKRQ